MDTLRLVEVTGDGDLVLMTGDGRRFSLSVDEQLRSAVRRSRSGPQVEHTSDRPGPREVQARIRAGADAEEVARQTGLDVDYVRRFEGPVLAERAHVADLARATAVDRGGDPTLTLERVVVDALTGEGLDVDNISWDSRRSDGTRWQVVVATDTHGSVEATWAFDTATRSLEPVDAEAERLTGVERRRRLSAVRETVFDVERPATTATRGGTVDLLDTLARQRGRRPTAPVGRAVELSDPDGTADDDAVDDGTAAAGTRAAAAEDLRTAGEEPADRTDAPQGGDARSDDDGDEVVPAGDREGGAGAGSDPAGSDGADLGDRSSEPDLLSGLDLGQPGRDGQGTRPQQPAATASDRRNKRRRAAVPSWDEIVFGAKRDG